MPFQLGARSLAQLEGVEPRLVRVVKLAIEISLQDFTVMQGLRSIEEERQHVANGTSRTMNSKHLKQPDGFGHAVDLVPWIGGRAVWDWEAIYVMMAAVREAAQTLKVPVRWGGEWSRGLTDIPLGPLTAPAALKKAHLDYVAAFAAKNGRAPLCDGPHAELLGP